MNQTQKLNSLWKSIISDKLDTYSSLTDDYSDLSIVAHNATWCPDCERETTELLALIQVLGTRAPKVEIIDYPNKEDYKKKKLSGELAICCLPTITFFNKDKIEIGKIEERANPSFFTIVKEVLES